MAFRTGDEGVGPAVSRLFRRLKEYVDSFFPRGVIGYAFRTTTFTPITVDTDVGLSVSWTADPSRRYRTTAYMEISGTVANDLVITYITDASNNVLQRSLGHIPTPLAAAGNAGYIMLAPSLIESGLSGDVTRKIRALRNIGTGTISIVAGTTWPRPFILVEDIGPA